MDEIFQQTDKWRASGEDVALATLIQTRGSAPRLPGARLAMTKSGLMAGSVSGGCVESDIFERSLQVLQTGLPQYVEYGIADELGFEVGLSCGGTINVLIEPYSDDHTLQAFRDAVDAREAAVLALAVEPQSLAGRRLVLLAGGVSGSISQTLDGAIAEDARTFLDQEGARLRTYGEASVFLETVSPPARLIIVGATHVAIHLARMARDVGFDVTVIDARGLFATLQRFPDTRVVRDRPEHALADLSIDGRSYIAILTHDPKFDLPALEFALRSDARYIGAMGSRKTQEQKREQLRSGGFSDTDLARIHGPIGFDIGARTPEEVAVSILAEIVAARYARSNSAQSGKPRE